MFLLAAALCVSAIVVPRPARAAVGSHRVAHAAPVGAISPEWVGALAEVVTAFGLGAVFWQIVEQRKAARREQTRGFQERYQSEAFDLPARRMIGCMEVDDAGGCVDVIEACSRCLEAAAKVLPWPDAPAKASVMDIDRTLNLFEEMGAAYELGQMDKQALLRSFSFPTIQVFVKSWWWICWEREGRLARQEERGVTEETYVEYQRMVLALKRENSSLAKDTELRPNEKVRALCLPKGSRGKVDDDAAWPTSRRLSLALSDFIRAAEGHGLTGHLAKLASDLEALQALPAPGAPRPRGWEVVLVPGQIDRPPDLEWERQRQAAAKLVEVLEGFPDYPGLEAAISHVEAGTTALR
jgi:hypothetical protein